MRLGKIVLLLEHNCPELVSVGFLTDITKIDVPADDTPAVYLFWSRETASQNDGAGHLINQAVIKELSVLIIARVPDKDSIDDEPLAEARDCVFKQLHGIEFDDGQLEYAGGEIERIESGLIAWRDNYQYTTYLRTQL